MITKIDIKLTNGTFVTLNYEEAKEVYEDLKKVFANTYVPPQLYPGSGTPSLYPKFTCDNISPIINEKH